MKKIIVAVDGSQSALKAVEKAREIQACFGSEVILYTNLEDRGNYMPEHHRLERGENQNKSRDNRGILLEDSRHWLSVMADSFPHPDKTTTMVDVGDVGKRIIEHSILENADCIMIGSRGYQSVKSVLLGSLSRYVAQNARCSVMVVK